MRLLLALLLLAAPAVAAAQQPPVRPARAAALSTPLVDDDLAWMAPLMAIQGGDLQRTNGHMKAAIGALQAHAADDAGAARVTRIRAGSLHALEELRGYSAHAVAPPRARYDAACSGELTGQTGGLATTAVFHVPDVAAARAFYRQRGWEVLGDAHSGYVLRAPDQSLRGSLGVRDQRTLVAHYEHNGVDMSGLRTHCASALRGSALTLHYARMLESEAQGVAAHAAAAARSPERLPDALRQAGLTSAQWDAVWTAITTAQSDEMLVDQPGILERDAGSAAAAARRRANVAWYRRNRAAVDAATRSATP
ncbi:MAG: hypothetical protein ACXWZS_07405 [Gemmatirosa sp.]